MDLIFGRHGFDRREDRDFRALDAERMRKVDGVLDDVDSPVIDGDLLYVQTSNGIDHNMDPYKEKNRKMPAPNAPNLIVLEKKTGRLIATDDAPIASSRSSGYAGNSR